MSTEAVVKCQVLFDGDDMKKNNIVSSAALFEKWKKLNGEREQKREMEMLKEMKLTEVRAVISL
jgi:hypothetical protein